MSLLITPSVVTSVVSDLIRYRDRVDTILSVREASEGLPFLLPPAPADEEPHLDDMVRFFASDTGQVILHLHGLALDYQIFRTDPRSIDNSTIAVTRARLFVLYFEAADIRPAVFGPGQPGDRPATVRGPEVGLRLAWYVVESRRLSRQPALVNLLLATADTLLEVAGQHAALFISHPRTRGLVESLLAEFALHGDFEEQSFVTLFRRLLGSTVVALADNPAKVQENGALKALFAALARVREVAGKEGDDIAAAIISARGFERFISALATEVASDPSFLTKEKLAGDVLAAVLTRIARDLSLLPGLFNDSEALLGILQAGINAAATSAANILDRKPGDGEPLLSAVLTAVLRDVATLARQDKLFAAIAGGEVISGLCRTALLAVADNPPRFATAGDLAAFTSSLVSTVATVLSGREIGAIGSTETLRQLAIESLSLLARYPGLLCRNHIFTTNLLGGLLRAGAVVMADGPQRADLIELAEQAIRFATDNPALRRLDTRLAAAIESAGQAIAACELTELVDARGRMAILHSTLRAIVANPLVWGRFQDNDLTGSLIRALLVALTTDRSGLLSGSVFVETASRLILVLSRRGQLLVETRTDIPSLQIFLTLVVKRIERELGRTIDSQSLPLFLERIALAALDVPAKIRQKPEIFIDHLLPQLVVDISRIWLKG